MPAPSVLAQHELELDPSTSFFGGPVDTAVAVVLLLVIAVSLWRVFTKMGQQGWTGVVPVLNFVSIGVLAGRTWWFGVVTIVPCVGFLFVVVLLHDLAKMFGHGVPFTIGLVVLPFVFLPVLAFAPSQRYVGRRARVF
jgi:hypothetical protein